MIVNCSDLVRQTPFGREGVKREGSQAGRKLSGKEVERDVWTRNSFLTHFCSKSRIAWKGHRFFKQNREKSGLLPCGERFSRKKWTKKPSSRKERTVLISKSVKKSVLSLPANRFFEGIWRKSRVVGKKEPTKNQFLKKKPYAAAAEYAAAAAAEVWLDNAAKIGYNLSVKFYLVA